MDTKNPHHFRTHPVYGTIESQIIHNRSIAAGLTCCLRFFSTIFLAFYVCTGIATVQAEFADDFSVDSIRYTGSSFESAGTASAIGEAGAIRMTASQNGTDRAERTVSTLVPSDTFLVTTTLDPATSLEAGSDAVAYFQVWGNLFNDLADNGNASDIGEVRLFFDIVLSADGTIQNYACVGRNGDNGFENVNLFDGGTSNCTSFDEETITVGTPLLMGYEFNRETNTLKIQLNDAERIVPIPMLVNAATYPGNGFQLRQEDGPGTAVARVTSISTERGTDDFAAITPVVDRYRSFFGLDGITRSAEVTDGRLRLSATALENSYEGVDIQPAALPDYLEAVMSISSESVFNQGQMHANAGIQGALFNDTADGGFDGIAGDVRAALDLSVSANGTRRAEYCVQRSNDANAEDRTGLLADGDNCESFPIRVELDRAYRAAINLDRAASTVTFRLDGFVKVVPINTGIFAAANSYFNVTASAGNLGKVVTYIDDIRTAPTALSPSEIASGATAPPVFPAEPDPASLQVDSTLDDPYDFTQSLDFVDDFSSDTSQLGFWGGRVRGDSSVQYLNQSIELQTNSVNTDDGNWSEFYINGVTNSLRARVSLSSKSILPADPNAQAEIGIVSIFHNDTQDYGFDGEAGDISASIRLRVRGDGRQSVGVSIRRRDAVGNQEDLRIIDGESFWDFDGFVPELDTVYELGIQIDRENRVLIVSLDDSSREIQLPTEAFLPAVRRAVVQVNHNGPSGRAVGSIHLIKTDTVDLKFAVNPPLLAPYRPIFNARHPGRVVEVIDGRLRLEADGRLSSGRDPRIVALGASDFVEAMIELSSESTVLPDGEIFIDVSGTLYNELSDGGINGSEGSVFATVRLVANGGGAQFVRYCAYRSTTSDFSDSLELITGDRDNCARFSFVPELDTMYPASVSLDRTAATLTFRLGDESHVYAIATDIFDPDEPFNGVRAHTTDGSVVIAFADDLTFSENAVPLAESELRLLFDDDNSNTSGGSSDGSSGCSISTGPGDPLFAWLVACALFGVLRGRNKYR